MIAIFPAKSQNELLPAEQVGKRLCQVFPYRWQAIIGINEPKPGWRTITSYPLRPRVLWRLWQDAAQLVGVRFGTVTCYAVIDIDQESLYHPQKSDALQTIRAALETIGICRTILIRSSWSGGLHLYIPLPENVPTFGLANALKQCLEAQELTIAPGQLEIFPNCKAYAKPGTFTEYNAHRLPLQPASGSSLLDEDLQPIKGGLEQFFQKWDVAAAGQDLVALKEAIAVSKANRRGKPHRRSTVVEEWRHDLQTEIEEGWTGYGQTNHLLKSIACYGVVFEGLSDEKLADYVLETATNLSGYAEWCRHTYEISLRTTVWARAAENYYWRLGAEPKRSGKLHDEASNNIVPCNLARSQDAQRRIKKAVLHLQEQGILPADATLRANAIADAGISLRTLYKYLELWHPKHLCKTPVLEPASPISGTETEKEPKSSNLCHSKEFYTSGEYMKGSQAEMSLALSIAISFPQPPNRPSFSEHFPFQTPATKEFQPFDSSVSTLEQQLLELFCVQAMEQNDRASVLARLMDVWRTGKQDFVRTLCQLHPEWKFRCGEEGVNHTE